MQLQVRSLLLLLLQHVLLVVVVVETATLNANFTIINGGQDIQAEDLERGWIGETVLSENDRLAFVRPRKVGSTALTTYLTKDGVKPIMA
eukprot:m.98162 g.98162  ORF g.98162 m.98162 type:complete len:90 (-) comp12512_c0_seq3:2541-2810(-)